MSNPVGTSYYMSPEVLQGKYTNSCDIWSVGITTYILLCGYPPFNGASEAEIKSTILNYGHAKNVNFTLRGWAGKSEECKDFIMCLLRRDPRKRFTAKEALMHPWLKIYC
jgi:calcium-dependent protein kinase